MEDCLYKKIYKYIFYLNLHLNNMKKTSNNINSTLFNINKYLIYINYKNNSYT